MCAARELMEILARQNKRVEYKRVVGEWKKNNNKHYSCCRMQTVAGFMAIFLFKNDKVAVLQEKHVCA